MVLLDSVSAIPCFPPKTPEEIRARDTLTAVLDLPEKGALLEMCYHPHTWTDICTLAKERVSQVLCEVVIWNAPLSLFFKSGGKRLVGSLVYETQSRC